MTKFPMCMQSFKSVDNQLAKLRREVDITTPLLIIEREGVEKYHLRGRVNAVYTSSTRFQHN